MGQKKSINHESHVLDLLKREGLSITEGRKRILGYFLNHHGALSHGDLEKKAGSGFDRVTIYRTLQTFVEKGIIHTIPSSDNQTRYALCKEECSSGNHRHHHVHFVCGKCQKTYCLDEVATPAVKLPKGYAVQQIEMLVQGTCRQCAITPRLR